MLSPQTNTRRWHITGRLAAAGVLLYSILHFADYFIRLPQRGHPSWPQPASLFVLLVLGVLFMEFSATRRARVFARISAGAALIASGSIAFRHIAGLHYDIPFSESQFSPIAAVSAFLLSGGLLCMTSTRRHIHVIGQFLLSIVVILMFMPLFGYLFSIDILYQADRFNSVPTWVFGIGGSVVMTLFLRPRSGWMGMVTSNDPGGQMIRRSLPIGVLLPVALAWGVAYFFQNHKSYNAYEQLDLAIAVAANLGVLFCVVTWVGRSLHQLEQQRRRTEQQRRESAIALEASERQYRFLSNSLPQVVWTCDARGNADYFNDRWTEYTGLSFRDSIARNWIDFAHPDDRVRTRQAWNRAVTRARPTFEVEYRLRRWDGVYRWHLVRAVPLEDANGAVIRWFGTCTDVDDQKKVADELRAAHSSLERRVEERTQELAAKTVALEEARSGAEAASTAKTSFLANMSHEIRTPLTAIVGFTDLVRRRPDSTERELREAVTSIHRNSQHLLQIVNDLLDLSKIEAGKLAAEAIPCSIPEQIGTVMQMFRLRAMEKGLEYSVNNAAPIPAICLTDPLRLRQILVNLLSNAVKFTESGRVTLRVSCRRDPDDSTAAKLYFDVIDTGIGMSADEIGRLFQPFMQADSSTTRRFGGTGLGLTISQRLARLLGGNLHVLSYPGEGTTFTLALPIHFPPETPWINDLAAAGAEAERDARGRGRLTLTGRILVAEDGEDNQRLLEAILQNAGARVTLVADGQAAVRAALAEHFDVVLMDMQMPIMDGYSAARELRAKGYTRPILALTAHALSEDRDRCLAAGCTDYLTKPIEEERFLSTIARHMPHAVAVDSFDAGSAARRPQPAPATLGESSPAAPARLSAAHSRYADHPVISRLLPQFVKDLQQQMTEAREYLHAGDRPAFAQLMHRIKGAGGAYGYEALTQQAGALEKQAMDDVPLEIIEGVFANLAAYAGEIIAHLDAVQV